MTRQMDLTEELVALVERTEPDPGPEPGTVEHTAADFDDLARDVLDNRPDGPVWLFAYGSLIWKPDFEAIETAPAKVPGWHRSFCLRLTRWRGTRETPALMLALDRGGSCTGIAYRLADDDLHAQIVRLLEREIDGNPPTNVPRWIRAQTPSGPIIALAFVADRRGPAYVDGLTMVDTAKAIAAAAGHWGTAVEYVFKTVSMLEQNGIQDRNLWRLQKLIAEEIMTKRP